MILQSPSLNLGLWPKQLLALQSPANELLYGGAAGPGKSHLTRVAFISWAFEIPGLQLFLFRRRYRDLVQGHMEGPTGFKSLLYPAVLAGLVQIVELEIRFRNGPQGGFEGGSRISLNHCQHEDTALDFKSIEFHVLGLEETTEFTKFQIQFLRSRVRMPDTVKIPDKYLMPKEFWRSPDRPRYSFPRCLYATNPGGASHDYIKKGFVDPHPSMTLFNAPIDDGGMLRQFIPALLTDNPSVDPEEYANTLSGLPPAYREALLLGLWSAPIGSFYPEWNRELHVVANFTPPKYWFKYRTFDWGSSDPFAVYWWCVSDGEEFTDDLGRKRWFPEGALIAYREWYGCNPRAPEKGVNMRNEDIAKGIVGRTRESTSGLTFTDNFPFADRGSSKNGVKFTMADDFMENGCPLMLGNTARVYGYQQLRARLQGIDGVPLFYVVEDCKYLADYMPALPYHELKREQAAESGEATHSTDAARIACAMKPITNKNEVDRVPTFKGADTISPAQILARQKPKTRELGRR